MNEVVLDSVKAAIQKKHDFIIPMLTGQTKQIITFVNSYCEELLSNFGVTLLNILEKKDVKREGELDNEEKLELDTLLKAEARKKLLEEVVYETFIIVSESFKKLMISISEQVRAGKITEWPKEERRKEFFEFLKNILLNKVSSFNIC
jgi:hypothetical protein